MSALKSCQLTAYNAVICALTLLRQPLPVLSVPVLTEVTLVLKPDTRHGGPKECGANVVTDTQFCAYAMLLLLIVGN